MFYAAFHHLSTCRQIGMGLGPIPWTAVEHYATAKRYDDEHRQKLHVHISAMDNAYLKSQNKSAK